MNIDPKKKHLFFRANGKPTQRFENLLFVARVNNVDELRAKIDAGEIYPEQLMRARGVGREMIEEFFPLGIKMREIEANTNKVLIELYKNKLNELEKALNDPLLNTFDKVIKAREVLNTPMVEFDKFTGLPKKKLTTAE